MAEAGLRVFPAPNRYVLLDQLASLWQADPGLLLHLKPNLNLRITGHPEFRFTVVTNQDGLRDDKLTTPQAFLAIGDSFTFGFGVEGEQSWPERLQDRTGLPVANLGWAGWSSYVYPAALRRHAVPLNAEVWLWAFFVNDLQESAGAEAFLQSGEQDYQAYVEDTGVFRQTSTFPMNMRTVELLAALVNPDLFLLPNSGSGVVEHDGFRLRYSQYPWEVTDPSDPTVKRGWQLTEAALLEARSLASQNGAQLVVVFVPSREHVYWPYLQEAMADLDVQQLDEVHGRLAELCRANDIAYLDLLPSFRQAALRGDMLYFADDGHWNAQGHDLAAAVVEAFLRESRVVP